MVMKITDKTTVGDALLVMKNVDFQDQMIPFTQVELPEMTYGQRIDLSEIKTFLDLIILPSKILLGMNEDKIMAQGFIRCCNFGRSVVKELNRLAMRDQKAFKYQPSPEEVKAGYYDMNHGVFATVDRIAQRLSIGHDDVFALPEKRVFAMLKIDFDNMIYRKKFNEIISKKK